MRGPPAADHFPCLQQTLVRSLIGRDHGVLHSLRRRACVIAGHARLDFELTRAELICVDLQHLGLVRFGKCAEVAGEQPPSGLLCQREGLNAIALQLEAAEARFGHRCSQEERLFVCLFPISESPGVEPVRPELRFVRGQGHEPVAAVFPSDAERQEGFCRFRGHRISRDHLGGAIFVVVGRRRRSGFQDAPLGSPASDPPRAEVQLELQSPVDVVVYPQIV
jgi:hypothetical protein